MGKLCLYIYNIGLNKRESKYILMKRCIRLENYIINSDFSLFARSFLVTQ